MRFRKLLHERVHVLLTSADINGSLKAISDHDIVVQDVILKDSLHICFTIPYKNLSSLLALTEKRGENIEIEKRSGINNTLFSLIKRPVLVLGLLGILFLSYWLPTRVVFVRIEGNKLIPSRQIIEQANLCGIGFGANRREVRSEKMKNALLAAMPQLQWAGVNTYGCTAVITVRERNDLDGMGETVHLGSVVALRDGVIREMTVQQGNALCRVGQAVKKGQTLVSAYTDCGIIIRATGAKAEIYGETQRSLSVITPVEYHQRGKKSATCKKYSFIIGKKRINFYKGSGISGGTCAKIYEERYLTLPGGFVLPIGIACEQYMEYDMSPEVSTCSESTLLQYAGSYLRSLMQAGEILRENHVYFQGDSLCRVDGLFGCYEMIGIMRPEEGIGENE